MMAKSMINEQVASAAAAGTFTMDGDLTVIVSDRLRCASPVRAFGPPADRSPHLKFWGVRSTGRFGVVA